jgi:hypothetical protein
MAQSGHAACTAECPLSGVKRTLRFQGAMSAFDPKRTSLTAPRDFFALNAGLAGDRKK